MISIIVPIYKAEQYLHRCIDSILAQTYADFELLLVDDGSPDRSGEICDEYARQDSRVRVFHKENGGVSSARNLGLDNACGEWITFVDADDYIEQGYLNIPDKCLEDLLIQNYRVFGVANNSVTFKKIRVLSNQIHEFINKNIVELWIKVPWAKFFKREIIIQNNIRFPLDILIGEDTIFVLEYLVYVKTIRFLSSASYVYKSDDCFARYKLTSKMSVQTLHKLYQGYEKLNVDSLPFLRFIFTFYWMLIYPKDYRSVKYWKNDKCVKRIYKIVRHSLERKWRIKYDFYLINAIYRSIPHVKF